jgi:hypothetical protein
MFYFLAEGLTKLKDKRTNIKGDGKITDEGVCDCVRRACNPTPAEHTAVSVVGVESK